MAGTLGYLTGTRVAPLQQLNLKLRPEVLAHWQAQAAAERLSVRDWLMTIAGPTAAPAGAALADRVGALEQSLTALCSAVAELQQARTPRPPAPPAAPVSSPADLPADGIETAALAELLGLKRPALNARISRAGGAAPGLLVGGWRCLGTFPSPRGGPPRALWVPAAT